MNTTETGFTFTCNNESLVGVISTPMAKRPRGVLIVVGGPQYRAGSHRQFTLLARSLASAGIPAMRFDYRGMGDSGGELHTFEHVEPDIRAAVDAFFERVPDLREVVLWGLCDAASAILFYAHLDSRVRGIALANPWVRTVEGLARAHLKHYYVKRLVDPALWRKVGAGSFRVGTSLRGLASAVWRSLGKGSSDPDRQGQPSVGPNAPLPDRMREGLTKFDGNVLMILSGNDLTAREFEDVVQASSMWRALLNTSKVTSRRLPEADHTFSRRQWRDQVAVWTEQWVRSW